MSASAAVFWVVVAVVPLTFWLGFWTGLGEAEKKHRATRQGRNLGRWS